MCFLPPYIFKTKGEILILELTPDEMKNMVINKIQNFEDIRDITLIANNTTCTLTGYDEDYINQFGEVVGYLEICFKTEECKHCYAPLRWFSQQITEITSIPEYLY